jgi:hypothetical protein
MKETLIILGVFTFWIVLNRWVLPWFGTATCMSGGCSTGHCPSRAPVTKKDLEQELVEAKGNVS